MKIRRALQEVSEEDKDCVRSPAAQVVGDAVAAALEDKRFDFRANAFTLIAITGVILYWRGVWTLWCAAGCRLSVSCPLYV